MKNHQYIFKYVNKESDVPEEFQEDITLVYDLENDPSIRHLHRMCKSFAKALGYSEKNIEEYFGETVFDVEEE